MSVVLAPISNPQAPFTGINNEQNLIELWFSIVCSGNYPALGDLMSFAQLGDLLKSQFAPVSVDIKSAKTGGLSGFLYGYTPGNPATPFNGKFQLLTASGAGTPAAPLVDAGAIAYPAGVIADTIIGRAAFTRL